MCTCRSLQQLTGSVEHLEAAAAALDTACNARNATATPLAPPAPVRDPEAGEGAGASPGVSSVAAAGPSGGLAEAESCLVAAAADSRLAELELELQQLNGQLQDKVGTLGVQGGQGQEIRGACKARRVSPLGR